MTDILLKILATDLILIAVVRTMITALREERSRGKSGTPIYVADLCYMVLIGILPILMISLVWSV